MRYRPGCDQLVRRLSWLTLLVTAGLVAGGAAPERLQVVATILPVYCIAANVGGDLAEVRYLVGAGGDGHDYQLTPRDRSDIENARLLLMNGLGIEPWIKRTLAAASGSLRVVDLSRGLESRLIPLEEGHGHGHGPGPREGEDIHVHGEMNPHVWLDPELMMGMVTNALRGFQQADPANAARYAGHAASYLLRLEALHAELTRSLREFEGTAIVTFHDAFPYFARRYKLKVSAVVEEIPDVDPTARHLARLSSIIRSERVRAIFVEPRHPRRLADRLGRDLGVKVGTLDTLEAGPPRAEAYETGMRGILRNLQSTLP